LQCYVSFRVPVKIISKAQVMARAGVHIASVVAQTTTRAIAPSGLRLPNVNGLQRVWFLWWISAINRLYVEYQHHGLPSSRPAIGQTAAR
jgi:hypothetical protein